MRFTSVGIPIQTTLLSLVESDGVSTFSLSIFKKCLSHFATLWVLMCCREALHELALELELRVLLSLFEFSSAFIVKMQVA